MENENSPLLGLTAGQDARIKIPTLESATTENAYSGHKDTSCQASGCSDAGARRASLNIGTGSNSNQLSSYAIPPLKFGGSGSLRELLPYYLPCFSWIPQYSMAKFGGDLIAGLSLASFQIPLALSYATSLAHVEPLCGLYSLALSPFVYAIFGSVPQMIVGPESAISIIVGQAVEKTKAHGSISELIAISAAITFCSGAILLFLGIFRLGFLGSIMSRALLRGFIAAVGVVMVIDSFIMELKLAKVLADMEQHYYTPFEKVLFIIRYAPSYWHKPTALMSGLCLVILLTLRYVKRIWVHRSKKVVLIPEILLLVICTIILSYKLDLKHSYGISIVGDFNTSGFDSIQNPLKKSSRELMGELLNTSIITAVLGFFESTTASKSLGSMYDLSISPNRELVALGGMNLFVSLFGGLPAFGGYGRSKINAFSGAQTVISGACMGGITMLTVKFLLPAIHYIPTCVLSVITTIVGLSLLEEAPQEIRFHFLCSGYQELVVFTLTVLCTLFYSIEAGIYIGCAFSVISIINHSAKSRIQILARLQRTGQYVNVDEYISNLFQSASNGDIPQFEGINGCLIVKIPEPLTFTNTEDLKQRLSRLEMFGSPKVHPGRMHLKSKDATKYVVFDLHSMTSLDSSATQIFKEIVTNYKRREVHVFLVGVPYNLEVRNRLLHSDILDMVDENKTHATVSANSLEFQTTQESDSTSPFFSSIDEALGCVEYIELLKSQTERTSTDMSIVSKTFVNSNIV